MAREPVEVIEIEQTRIGCDGGDGALGHPMIYLTVERDGKIDCPYCGRRFVLKEGAKVGHH